MRSLLLLLAVAPVALAAEPAPMPRPAGPVTFAQIVTAAAADARSLPPGVAAATRYLSAAHLPDTDRRELYKVVSYHVNSLSRESKITPPRPVTPWLWAVCLDDYRWRTETWESLATKNVYFAVKAKVTTPGAPVTKQRQVLRGGYYVTESYTEAGPAAEREDAIVAPWLPPAGAAELVSLTGSRTPVVRADQFLNLTAVQVGRKGHGYYDWLGLAKLADLERLTRLDRKGSEELYRELAAIVTQSGVAPNNRQVFRLQALTGGYWETRDVFGNDGDENAVDRLLEDFKPKAFEVVAVLPNRLPVTALADDKGALQDTAPDTIATDRKASNNDHRVHAGTVSCLRCHRGGLHPIADYARSYYNATSGVALGALAVAPDRVRRLESAYLGPLARDFDRDNADFDEAFRGASGLKSADLAAAVGRQWSLYLDEPVTREVAAAEAGYPVAEFVARLRAAGAGGRPHDLILAAYLSDENPRPVRREHFEGRFGLLMLTLQGVRP